MQYIEFEKGTKHARTGADVSNDPSIFTDCGALIEDKYVVIDIDCLEWSKIEAMIQFFDIETQYYKTDRGIHLWYLKPRHFKRATNHVCQMGFPIEMKTKENTPNGITVKRNGIMRECYNEGTFQELPLIFDDRKKYENILGMDEGEGRNDALFRQRAKLNNCVNWIKVMTYTNQYVFAKPLDNKEFQSITRDSLVIEEQEINESYVAEQIMNNYLCKNFHNRLWYYDGEKYVSKDTELVKIVYSIVPNRRTAFVDEVIKQVKYKSQEVNGTRGLPIRFKNGILLENQFVEVIDKSIFSPYFIDIDYIENATPVPIVDEYINNLTNNDPTYKRLLKQVLGFILITDAERIRSLGRFFFLRGDGANGKGTLLQIIKAIFNPDNCSSSSISELTNERYKVDLMDKLVNLGDDVEPNAITNEQMKVLKNISTADTISIRQLYHEAESKTMTVKLIFTTNADIRSFEKGYAYRRRVLWLPMFNKVTKVDPNFITKITTQEALLYWTSLIVEGYFDLMQNGWCDAECEAVVNYNQRYHENNNYMIMFIKDFDEDVFLYKNLREVQEMFDDWSTNDYKWSKSMFVQAIWEVHKIGIGVKKVNGKSKRVLMKQSETSSQDLTPKN